MKIMTHDVPHQREPEQLSRLAASNGRNFCKGMRARFSALSEKSQRLLENFEKPAPLSSEEVSQLSSLDRVWAALAVLEDELNKELRAHNKSADSDTSPRSPPMDFQAVIDAHWASVADANRKEWDK